GSTTCRTGSGRHVRNEAPQPPARVSAASRFLRAGPVDGLPLADRNCSDLEVRFEGPGLVGFGDICGAGDEVRVVGVLAPSPCLGLAERLGGSPRGRERALYRERHSLVFGVIDPAVAASGDDQGVLAV